MSLLDPLTTITLRSRPILIGPGALSRLGDFLPSGGHPSASFIVADGRAFGPHSHSVMKAAASAARPPSVLEVEAGENGSLFGVGIHPNIVIASLRAMVSAVNRKVRED